MYDDATDDAEDRSVWAGGLLAAIDDGALAKIFARCGEVVRATVVIDFRTGVSRRCVENRQSVSGVFCLSLVLLIGKSAKPSNQRSTKQELLALCSFATFLH